MNNTLFKVNPLRRQQGQGMMEYVIIVALIAVAAIGIYSAFGKTMRNQTAGLSKEMAGADASTQISNAANAANASAGRANDPNKVGMGRYNYANDQGGASGGGGAGGGGSGGGGG